MSIQKYIYLIFVCLVLTIGCPQKSFSQNIYISIDTTDYLPYPWGLDYNLMIAASKGYTDEVNRMINLGAEIDGKTNEGATPLMFAVANNKLETVKLLLSKGADPNIITTYYETPLLAAVKNGNQEIAEVLVRNKAFIDFTDRAGASSLHYSSIYGNLSLTDMLLYYGADVDIASLDGSTPLISAVWVGFSDIADLLIQNGADVNKKDNNGFSSFLVAAQNGDTVIMNLLRSAGADIYETNKYYYNALCVAIKENHIAAVNYLLDAGNLWETGLNGAINPMSVAIKYRRKEIIEILNNNNIKGTTSIKFDQFSLSVSSAFTGHDLFTGVSIKVKEPLLNAGIIIGYDFKPVDTRVILQTGESQFYQYIDRRSVFFAGIFKDIDLTDRSLNKYWYLSFSLSGAYTFGNNFKGTNLSPDNKLSVVPSVQLNYQFKKLDFYGGLEYMKTEFYKIGPVWFRAGFSYTFFFDNVRSPGKVISWY